MRKGKTYRRRVKSRSRWKNPCLDMNDNVIELLKWKKSVLFRIYRNTKLMDFSDTGRGVMALENINADDILMEVPCEAIISLLTLENDREFKDLFFPPDSKIELSVACQELLAFYLLYMKIYIKDYSYWNPYINMLPMNFTMPYFLDSLLERYLDTSIIEIIKMQRQKILSSYNRFCQHIHDLNKNNVKLVNFNKEFSLNVYEWAYFIVNTRCVYLNPTIIREARACLKHNREMSIFSLLSDEPNLGLVPYLDMFNHSTEAKTSAILIKKAKFNNHGDPVFGHNNLVFELKTLTSFKKYDQIFISYGQHCNLKLFTEYGFTISGNPLTTLNIDFDDICSVMRIEKLESRISNDKYKFIKKHNLDKNLNVNEYGYGYNFLRLLYLLTDDDKKLWNMKVFSNDFTETESMKMNKIGKIILETKKSILENKIQNILLRSNLNIICKFTLNLMEEFVSMIDNILNMGK